MSKSTSVDFATAQISTVQHFSLANGLRVYLREDHRAPLVSAQLWYHVGAGHEQDGHTGLSHALEHLMFEGSSKLAPGQYSTLITRLGGEPNAFTLPDATVFPLTLPASRLEVALEAMADAMDTATLDEAAFARELDVVVAERRANVENHPLALALEKHQMLAHGSSQYAAPAIGHLADLELMTLAATRTWFQTWYHPNNATLSVVGAIDRRRLQALVEKHFGAILAHRLPAPLIPREDQALTRRMQTLRTPGLREGLIMSFNTPSHATARTPAQAYALRLLPDLLTEGASSKLYRRLINDEQVVQSLKSVYEPFRRGDSLFTLYAFSNAEKLKPEDALDRVLSELETLRKTVPFEKELNRAKTRLIARQIFARDDISEQADAIGRHSVCGLDPMSLDEERQAIEGVTGEQVRQVINDYLTEHRLAITLMHDEESPHE